jgi:hypothetical protein
MHALRSSPALPAAIPAGRLDPVAAWRALPLRAQEEVGAAAIALTIGVIGTDLTAAQPYLTAMQEAADWLRALIEVAVLGNADVTQPPPVPDLSPFGIRQCTGCGCTDHHACAGGCTWIEIDGDRCTACGPEAAREARA